MGKHFFIIISLLLFAANTNAAKEQNDYYPFGKLWEGTNVQAPATRYTFSGKERQTAGEVNYMDFGARMLDNDFVPVWTTQDPLAEMYYSYSPYAYCLNNPVNLIDPYGMWSENSTSWTTDDPNEIADFWSWLTSLVANVSNTGGGGGCTFGSFGGNAGGGGESSGSGGFMSAFANYIAGLNAGNAVYGGILKDVTVTANYTSSYLSMVAANKFSPSSVLFGEGHWIGKNGQTYNMSLITNRGRGWHFYQNSANIAKNASRVPRGIGIGLGVLTTTYSGYQFVKNPTFGNGFSVAEGVGSLLYWPFGLADSYVHFATDVVIPDVQRRQLELLKRIDNGTFNPWDYRNVYPNLTGPCP